MTKTTINLIFAILFIVALLYSAVKNHDGKTGKIKYAFQIGGMAFVLYSCHAILLYVAVSVASGFERGKAEKVLAGGGLIELTCYILFLFIALTPTMFLWNHIKRLGDKPLFILSILMFLSMIALIFFGEWIAIQTAPTVLISYLFVVGILVGQRQYSMEKQLELEEELRQMNEENQKELDAIREKLEACRKRALEEEKTESAEYLKGLIERLEEQL